MPSSTLSTQAKTVTRTKQANPIHQTNLNKTFALGIIQFDEWILWKQKVLNPTVEDWAALVIDLYDTDGSGSVSRAEVRKLAFSKAKIEGRLNAERIEQINNTIEKIFKFADTSKYLFIFPFRFITNLNSVQMVMVI